MKTPTEQAMIAAQTALPATAFAAKHHKRSMRVLIETAKDIDTAAGLPALIAERDALRKALSDALGWLQEAIAHQPDDFDSSALKAVADRSVAALALSAKGQP